MSLHSIKESVQEVAEAIGAVLGVDVTIIDNEFKRIASTGEYRKYIGDKIPSKCLFEYVINEKKPYYVCKEVCSHDVDGNKDDDNLICNQCEAKNQCMEYGTIGYPIISNDEVIGVIGINIFTKEQSTLISMQYKSMLQFLKKLSSLLIGNIAYTNTIHMVQIQKEETNKIIDSLTDGVMCIDNKGLIKYINNKGKKILGINKDEEVNISIKDVIKNFKMDVLSEASGRGKVFISTGTMQLVMKVSDVILNEKKVSTIVQFNKKSDEVRDAYKIFGNQRAVSFDDIIGNSKAMIMVKNLAKKVARGDSTVLLQGESGTGKELFARAIHYSSERKEAPFIPINCASIPDNLLESEFFGYEGGAFTGARKEGQMGKFELASGGTIFLDEIGDLPLHLQPKILRVLQEHTFTKICGKEEIFADVRIVAATNRNLKEMVKSGEFREDLYYRLSVIPIDIPKLTERGDDIYLLSNCLLKKYCNKYNIDLKVFHETTLKVLKGYSWPGNIRELENAIEYAINTSQSEKVIMVENLPLSIRNSYDEREKSLKEMVDEYEKSILITMINTYGNDAEGKNKIAIKLGMDLSTLYRKLNKYKISK